MKKQDEAKRIPPYMPTSTFTKQVDSWRVALPSRIDRSVLSKVAGSMQTWLIATLRYFNLVTDADTPTPRLVQLVKGSDADRRRIYLEMLKSGYPFLFDGSFDIATATHSQLREKFTSTGAQGDTVNKAISFFTGLAREAGLELSPFLLTRQRRVSPPARRKRAITTVTPEAAHLSFRGEQPVVGPVIRTKGPIEMLIEILDPEKMDKDEEQAVWTLLRYLKKGGGS